MVVRRQKVKEYQEKEEGVNQGNGTRKDRKKKNIYIYILVFFSDFNGRISIGRTGILNMHCFQNEVHAGTYAILPL